MTIKEYIIINFGNHCNLLNFWKISHRFCHAERVKY